MEHLHEPISWPDQVDQTTKVSQYRYEKPSLARTSLLEQFTL